MLRNSLMTAAAALFPQCIQNPGPGAAARPPTLIETPPDWELVWSDEFDGDRLDTSRWNHQFAHGCELGICGWGNHEIQYYTDRPRNVRVEDGHLVLEVHEEPVDSALTSRYPGFGTDSVPGGYNWRSRPDTFKHTSARITTKGKGDWTFGKVEVRAKIPDGGDGAGLWPAIWMLPTQNAFGTWPRSGEIDIMEAYGPRMDTVHQTFHWWGGEGTRGSHVQTAKALHPEASWADSFHVYGLVWTRGQATLSIDGREYITRRNNGSVRQYPFLEKFHLIMNIAVGGGALRGGVPFGLTRYPQTMRVDWVRVYRDRNLEVATE